MMGAMNTLFGVAQVAKHETVTDFLVPGAMTVSVILQVVYFRYTKGRRLFKMAPLHNHFELSGWSETQIVQRFWLVGLLAAGIGIALALI